MRFLRVIRSATREHGGPIEGIIQSGLALKASGHEVEILSLDPPSASFKNGFPLPLHCVGRTSQGYGYSPDFVPWLTGKGPDFDAVIVSGLWQYSGVGTRRAAQSAGFGYWVFPHGMLDPWFKRRYPLKHLKKWLYWPWADYRVLRDAKAVLFTTEEERILARQSFWLYRCREEVVSYGTAAPPDRAADQAAAFATMVPAVSGKPFLLFLGRIHEKKGCDLLVTAFAKVCVKRPELDLVIAGPADGELGPRLKSLAEQLGVSARIHWPGMLQGDAKWGAFRACEAFILPSHQENFGIAVAEALAAARPVLTTNKVNIWREITGDDAGLVADDTQAGIDDLLTRWLATPPGRRAAMSANALRCFTARFEIGRVADHLVEVVGRTKSGADSNR